MAVIDGVNYALSRYLFDLSSGSTVGGSQQSPRFQVMGFNVQYHGRHVEKLTDLLIKHV